MQMKDGVHCVKVVKRILYINITKNTFSTATNGQNLENPLNLPTLQKLRGLKNRLNCTEKLSLTQCLYSAGSLHYAS